MPTLGNEHLGVFPGLSNEEYHAFAGLSFSKLKELARSPAHYKQLLAEPVETTPAMRFGTAVHTAVLEPELFDSQFIALPEGLDRRTKEGKAAYAEVEASGKGILTADEMIRVKQMARAVYQHPIAKDLLTQGKAEQSIFWEDKETGVLCKCRPDYLRSDGLVIDLKTTDDASPRGFQRTIGAFSYHMQSAFYLNGVSAALGRLQENFVHLVVEKFPPYGIGVYVLDDASLSHGRDAADKLLKLYKQCKESNTWPGYEEKIQNISIPQWMW